MSWIRTPSAEQPCQVRRVHEPIAVKVLRALVYALADRRIADLTLGTLHRRAVHAAVLAAMIVEGAFVAVVAYVVVG